MFAKNEQNNKNLANCKQKPNLINKHCKHCLSCLLKGMAQKKELEGAIESAKWLNNIETAELYITRARQADAIQRMLGVQPGPWGVPYQDTESKIRARRNLSPLQVCIPLQYTNIKQSQGRITFHPDVALIPKWSILNPDKPSTPLQSNSKHKSKKSASKFGKTRVSQPNSKNKENNQQVEFNVMDQSGGRYQFSRKSPVLSPGQFIHFTWLSICKVAAGMKRKLTPSKQMSVQEPVAKIPSFSELMQNKPCRPSREMISYKLVDCERSRSTSYSEDSVETVTTTIVF